MTFRLTVKQEGQDPVTCEPTIMDTVSAYRAIGILMGADLRFRVTEPVPYAEAREFAEKLGKAPLRWEMKHGPTGLVFSISGRE